MKTLHRLELLAALSIFATVSASPCWSQAEPVGPEESVTAETETPSGAISAEESSGRDSAAMPSAIGSMVFVSPETGELVSVPSAGQMQRLLALGRALATQRDALVTEADGNETRRPVLFETPVGVGARLDDRFLHALTVRFDETGTAQWMCTSTAHEHSDTATRPLPGSQPVAQAEAPES